MALWHLVAQGQAGREHSACVQAAIIDDDGDVVGLMHEDVACPGGCRFGHTKNRFGILVGLLRAEAGDLAVNCQAGT